MTINCMTKNYFKCMQHWAETSDPSHFPIPQDWVTIPYPTTWDT